MKSLSVFSAIILVIVLFSTEVLWAQETPRPDPGQVFAELLKPYRNLNDYTVKINATVNLPAIRVPDFAATLYFKKPDRFHIETKSFAPIPRNGGFFNPSQFAPEKNLISYQRTDNLEGIRADLYKVEPLDAKTMVRYYNVWVGGNPRRIIQMENLSFRGIKGLVKLSYATVVQEAEKWLLPEKIHIHLTFPEGVQSPDASSFTAKDSPISGGRGRLDELSGEGDIHITYSSWKINTGLDNSLFKK